MSKQQILAVYHGHPREMCPHVIGYKNGREKALFYQFGGTSSSGRDARPGSPENWRCLFIDELSDVLAQDGPWHTADNHSSNQTCVDDVDVEVEY
ncbi:hypothetical protein [Pseudoxanthomonas winnipegensis]|uniref:hypothetical protein n=1 Tax=Pseudoxanthomonas winnipegensis TaxID=2480810 RepID=UPI00197E4C5A|nr:hypothetical protein [Pseudoxanthomonas winnipegensis]